MLNDIITGDISTNNPECINLNLDLYNILREIKPVIKGGLAVDILTSDIKHGDLDVEVYDKNFRKSIKNINYSNILNNVQERINNHQSNIILPNIGNIIPETAGNIVFHTYNKICYKINKINKVYIKPKIKTTFSVINNKFSLLRFYLPIVCDGEIIKHTENSITRLEELELKYLFLDIAFVPHSMPTEEIIFKNTIVKTHSVDYILTDQLICLISNFINKNIKLDKRITRFTKLYSKYKHKLSYDDISLNLKSCKLEDLFSLKTKVYNPRIYYEIVKELHKRNIIAFTKQLVTFGPCITKEQFYYISTSKKGIDTFFNTIRID